MEYNTPLTSSDQENSPLLDMDTLQLLTANNPAIVAVVRSPDLKIFYVNSAFEYYLGFSNDDLNGRGLSFSDLIEDYQIEHLKNQLSLVNESIHARSGYVIYRLKRKDGKIFPFYLYAGPFHYPNDRYGTLYYIHLHPDLSKWGMPFTSFDSKELFLEQFNSVDFGTFEWIMNVDKVFWSEGVYHIYEVEENIHEISNRFTSDFIHPDDKARVIRETKISLETGSDLNTEFKIVTAKKNIKIIHCLGRTIKNSDGLPVKFAGSVRDITEQKHIEEDLKSKVEQLYESNRELEDFAYVASHDLQEPLRKITTFSDRLSEKYKDVLSGDGAMYLSRMIAAAENMRSLISDLLEFSRITKTGQVFETVSLDAILRQAQTDLELVIEETGTIINSQPLPEVEAISSQMTQLFTNIISNAIKFHKPGIVPVLTIEASTLTNAEKLDYELTGNTPYCKIQFTDNGIGFEEEYATRIFQVFQRLHGKSEYPGSGIGLAICKKIIEHHHGIIYAQNIDGIGARFVFILPIQQKPKF